jgi:hypothetical protein
MWPSTTVGSAVNTKVEYTTNDVDLYHLDFDPGTQEYAQASVVMPSDWNGGTVTAAFYWLKVGTNTGDVLWECQGRSYGDSEAIDQAWGTPQAVTDTGIATTNVLQITSDTPAITLAGTPAAGELVQFRVSRDATNGGDTQTADARLVGVMISYTRT